MDVDSLFALDGPSLEEGASTAPPASVFFDSAPTGGRASRFRQLFAQDPPPQRAPVEQQRPSVDRTTSNPVFSSTPKPSSSVEDREGFQRIMAMLGGTGGPPKGNIAVLHFLGFTHGFSSWTSHPQCKLPHNLLCRTVQSKASLKPTSSNVSFDKDRQAVPILHHSLDLPLPCQ